MPNWHRAFEMPSYQQNPKYSLSFCERAHVLGIYEHYILHYSYEMNISTQLGVLEKGF